jgi:hypothetical protein
MVIILAQRLILALVPYATVMCILIQMGDNAFAILAMNFILMQETLYKSVGDYVH